MRATQSLLRAIYLDGLYDQAEGMENIAEEIPEFNYECMWAFRFMLWPFYRGADKSLALPTFRCILFDGENISFDASLFIYINSTNIPPIMIINRIYEHQNLLSL
jgi:hypothetical protein